MSASWKDTMSGFVKVWDNSSLGQLPSFTTGAAVGTMAGAVAGFRRGSGVLGTIGSTFALASTGLAVGGLAAKAIGFGVDYMFRSTPPAIARAEYNSAKLEAQKIGEGCNEIIEKLGDNPPLYADAFAKLQIINKLVDDTNAALNNLTDSLGKTAEFAVLTPAQRLNKLAEHLPQWLGNNTAAIEKLTDQIGATEALKNSNPVERIKYLAQAIPQVLAEQDATIAAQKAKLVPMGPPSGPGPSPFSSSGWSTLPPGGSPPSQPYYAPAFGWSPGPPAGYAQYYYQPAGLLNPGNTPPPTTTTTTPTTTSSFSGSSSSSTLPSS